MEGSLVRGKGSGRASRKEEDGSGEFHGVGVNLYKPLLYEFDDGEQNGAKTTRDVRHRRQRSYNVHQFLSGGEGHVVIRVREKIAVRGNLSKIAYLMRSRERRLCFLSWLTLVFGCVRTRNMCVAETSTHILRLM